MGIFWYDIHLSCTDNNSTDMRNALSELDCIKYKAVIHFICLIRQDPKTYPKRHANKNESRVFLMTSYSVRDYGPGQVQMFVRVCAKCTDSDSYSACAKSHPGICSPLIHSIVSIDSVSGQGRHSLSAYAQRHVFVWCGPYREDIHSFAVDTIIIFIAYEHTNIFKTHYTNKNMNGCKRKITSRKHNAFMGQTRNKQRHIAVVDKWTKTNCSRRVNKNTGDA